MLVITVILTITAITVVPAVLAPGEALTVQLEALGVLAGAASLFSLD